jgi:tRNA threonylcarbamoyladenosine biosynthesis protein TsaB
MLLLAVDTASGQGSLALARDDGWNDVVALTSEWTSTSLHVELAAMLARNRLTLADVDGYAATGGPGGFTGVRLGLTAVKGLAEVDQKPVVAVSTLEVVASAARSMLPALFAGRIAALLDARRGQVFGALYDFSEATVRPVIPDCVCSLQDFLERVREKRSRELHFCSTEMELFYDELAAAGWPAPHHIAVAPALAATLARIGLARLQRGEGVPAADVDANYIRPSDAELFWNK